MHELNPLEWAARPLIRYADFNGRAPRAEYWWFALAYFLVGIVIRVADGRIAEPIFAGYGPLRIGVSLALLVPTYAVTARRLHDTDRTGWWLLARIASSLLLLVPLLHWNASKLQQMPGWFIVVSGLVALGWACAEIALLVFLVTPGDQGPNRYGSDPYGPDELEQVFA